MSDPHPQCLLLLQLSATRANTIISSTQIAVFLIPVVFIKYTFVKIQNIANTACQKNIDSPIRLGCWPHHPLCTSGPPPAPAGSHRHTGGRAMADRPHAKRSRHRAGNTPAARLSGHLFRLEPHGTGRFAGANAPSVAQHSHRASLVATDHPLCPYRRYPVRQSLWFIPSAHTLGHHYPSAGHTHRRRCCCRQYRPLGALQNVAAFRLRLGAGCCSVAWAGSSSVPSCVLAASYHLYRVAISFCAAADCLPHGHPAHIAFRARACAHHIGTPAMAAGLRLAGRGHFCRGQGRRCSSGTHTATYSLACHAACRPPANTVANRW